MNEVFSPHTLLSLPDGKAGTAGNAGGGRSSCKTIDKKRKLCFQCLMRRKTCVIQESIRLHVCTCIYKYQVSALILLRKRHHQKNIITYRYIDTEDGHCFSIPKLLTVLFGNGVESASKFLMRSWRSVVVVAFLAPGDVVQRVFVDLQLDAHASTNPGLFGKKIEPQGKEESKSDHTYT